MADETSCLSDVKATTGNIHASVAACVKAKALELDGAVLVNVTAAKITAKKNSICYNVVEAGELFLDEGEVVTDIFMEDGTKYRQRSKLDLDGGKKWKEAVAGNKFSFEQVYKMNLATDVSHAATVAAKAHEALAKDL